MAGADPLDPTSLVAPPPRALQGLAGVEGALGARIGVAAAYLETEVDSETVRRCAKRRRRCSVSARDSFLCAFPSA